MVTIIFSTEMAADHATIKMLDGAMILRDGLILKALELSAHL
jgi:hypothetical protein